MNRLVVDASVVVKWYTREDQRDQALDLRRAHMNGELFLLAPTLLIYEVANALRYNQSLTPEDQEHAAAALFLIGIEYVSPTQEQMMKASQLAYRYDTTIYDAVYLSLAIQQDISLVTADRGLAEKARETGKITELASLALQ